MKANGTAKAILVIGWIVVASGAVLGVFTSVAYNDVISLFSGIVFSCAGILILGLGEGVALLHRIAETVNPTLPQRVQTNPDILKERTRGL